MLHHRATISERMDLPDFSRQEVLDTFRFIEPVNRWFGGHRPIISFFSRESQSWQQDRMYHILDVGCGAGDIPVALARWARQTGFRLRVDAIDNHPDTVRLAQQRCRAYPEINVSHQDLFALPGGHADYVLASMLLHHFNDEAISTVLAHLLAQCRPVDHSVGGASCAEAASCRPANSPKVIINDLLRAPLAYWGTWLFSLAASPVFRHDARLSVRKGFTLSELRRLLAASSPHHYRLETHFFYRFLLIVHKEEPSSL